MLTFLFLFLPEIHVHLKKRRFWECLEIIKLNIFANSFTFMSNLFVHWSELFTPFVGLNRTCNTLFVIT